MYKAILILIHPLYGIVNDYLWHLSARNSRRVGTGSSVDTIPMHFHMKFEFVIFFKFCWT